jgi:hypothetical protein
MGTEVTYELQGHFAGHSIVLGGFRFVEGRYVTSEYSEKEHSLLARHLGQWGGVRGDGKRTIQKEGTEEIHSDVQPDGGGTPPDPSFAGCEVVVGPSIVPPGQELESSPGIGPKSRLRDAILSLDKSDASNWTQAGKPALTAIERALGSAGVTRAEVEAACPRYTRTSE